MNIVSTPKFTHEPGNHFHQELKHRVQQYFKENNKSSTGNFALHFKAILLWSLYIAGYVHLVFFTPVTWVAILETLVLGCLTAAIGFNVMHDGGHGSFSKNKLVNKLAAFSVNLLGASAIMWNTKHNIIHHSYTNIHGVDDDIEARPFLRMCPSQKKYKFHRFQHIYVWLLYPMLLLLWVFVTDYRKYFTGRVGAVAIRQLKPMEHVSFWVAKFIYIVIMVALPIYQVGFISWLVGYLIIATSAGFILSIVFQLAHTVEEAAFPDVDEKTNKVPQEWAVHQLSTTANFATRNKIVNWFTGGLNFQVEHHLFPKISHVHYPAISKIVKETCEEFNVQYIEFKRVRHAVRSHFMHLKHMGVA